MNIMTDCTYINCGFFADNFMWKWHQFGNIQGGKILERKVQAAQSHSTLSPPGHFAQREDWFLHHILSI